MNHNKQQPEAEKEKELVCVAVNAHVHPSAYIEIEEQPWLETEGPSSLSSC